MANNQHSYAKRQREIEKKRKADEKRARKLAKGKPAPEAVENDAAENGAEETPEDSVDGAAVPPQE